MDRTTLIGWTLMPLGLLVAAWLIGTARLWSHTANYTVPWFCTTLAVCLLAVGGLAVLCNVAPARIPIAAASLFYAGAVMIIGVPVNLAPNIAPIALPSPGATCTLHAVSSPDARA